MKGRFSAALLLAAVLTVALTSLVLAAVPPAFVLLTTDAPCPVSVLMFYTDPADQPTDPRRSRSESTPFTLETYPGTLVTVSYPLTVTCPDGITHNLITISPSVEFPSGEAGTTITVTGSYLDTTPPTLHLPANMTVEATGASGAVVTFTATADDANPAQPVVSCTPASGSTFGLGTTAVNCSATDAAGNTATGSFTVTVQDTTAPTIADNADMTVEGNTIGGANVIFSNPVASDIVDNNVAVTCAPVSGSFFALGGPHTVICMATDDSGNSSSSSFNVTVVDTTPPVLTLPADMTVNTPDASGAVVNFSASAIDSVDGLVPVICLPASGSLFTIGTTTVNCTAADSHTNTTSGNFNVTVTIVDTTPPVWNVPSDFSVEATGPAGAVVTYAASATDPGGVSSQSCSPASGATFALGTTTVNCTAMDTHGNTGTASFNVTVVDTTPPALMLPPNLAVTALDASGAMVTFAASAVDLVDGPVAVTCTPASGSTFPLGTTAVNCSAADTRGNTANGSFTVTVQYASQGTKCKGVPGHQILQPINIDGSSVFKQGSTVPAKFRVCGADGNPIETPGVVTDFRLMNSDLPVLSNTANVVFRSGNNQWIFNIDTSNLTAGNTYVYLITLNDGSTIQFQFALK